MLSCLWVGVVVADDMQLDTGMGFGDQLQERQELGVGVPRVAGVGGDLAGGDLKCGEQPQVGAP